MRLSCVLTSVLTLLAAASSAEEPAWRTIERGTFTLRVRQRPGDPVSSVWAEGTMDADARDIQAAILDVERYPAFMPYVKENWRVGPVETDGSYFVYTRVAPPIVRQR